MVELSLRKTRAFKSSDQSSRAKNNPYASLKNNNLGSSNQNVALPSIAKKDQEKIGKLMQRRMSVHQSEVPKMFQQGVGGAGGVPALPKDILINHQQQQQQQQQSLPRDALNKEPANYGSNVANLRHQGSRSSKGIDLQDPAVIQLLSDANFNPEQFISSRLNDSTASDIDKFNSNLTTLNKKVTNDIKAVANQTYDKLLNATKELNSTDNELKFLRNAINELSDLTNEMKLQAEKKIQLELDQTNEITKSNSQAKRQNRAKDRSSILVLEKMWASEMSSLFKHVEGAQKYIAAIPGRHVIAESGRWYELNAATFKTLQPAHIFLLNDLILIATRRRKTGQRNKGDGVKQIQSLVADQCWPLKRSSID
ncbi:unnamed protein product [Wickerhamomyces anomalus]